MKLYILFLVCKLKKTRENKLFTHLEAKLNFTDREVAGLSPSSVRTLYGAIKYFSSTTTQPTNSVWAISHF